MTTTSTHKLLCSLLVVFLHFYRTTSLFTYGFEVHVINNLSTPVTVHCASRNNDFGFKSLSVNEDFHWSFQRNFWLRTLYFCHFWSPSNDKAFEVFNYFISENCRYDQLQIDGNQCVWVVREDGFYFDNQFPPQNLVKLHDWYETSLY